jgi:hypothetical protein
MVEKRKCKGPCGKILILNLENFRTRSDTGKHLYLCRNCEREYHKNYVKNNYKKELKRSRKYRRKHKERINAYRRKIYHSTQKNDPAFKVRNHCTRVIRARLTHQNKNKSHSSIDNYLPYTIEELKRHLELLWEPWMNWDNYGVYKIGGLKKWHIDHIIPQSKLPYDSMDHPNFQKCWALSNLRPLEALANLRKAAS